MSDGPAAAPTRHPSTPSPRSTAFLIALPYGTRADWLHNVLAAGSRDDRQRQGESFDVDEPIIAATAEVAAQIPARTLRTLRLFGVTECVHLRRTTA